MRSSRAMWSRVDLPLHQRRPRLSGRAVRIAAVTTDDLSTGPAMPVLVVDSITHAAEIERFLSKIVRRPDTDPADPSAMTCAIWTRAIADDGYGTNHPAAPTTDPPGPTSAQPAIVATTDRVDDSCSRSRPFRGASATASSSPPARRPRSTPAT